MATPRPATSATDLTGTRVGRFQISARIASGGMGEVYRAEDLRLKRTVAVKRLAARLRLDDKYRQRFLKEAERASGLSHPHIASIYDVLEEDGELFLVMEYVEGRTLRRAMDDLDLNRFLGIAIQCAEALAAAHARHIVHCDIKPENIMLTPSGAVKVLDFGLAKQLPHPGDSATAESLETAEGAGGTPGYMAPEVLLQKPVDGRADLFSLGVVFYEILAKRHPFQSGSYLATAERILHETPPPLSQLRPWLPPHWDGIVAKLLAKDPSERCHSATELVSDLKAVESGAASIRASHGPQARPSKRRKARWMAGVGIGLMLVLVLVLAARPRLRQRLEDWIWGTHVPDKKNLAVLPFVAVGGDAQTAAFSDGLTETVNARLTQLTDRRNLQVVPPSEVRAQHLTSAEQAREQFGANLVLEGSLSRARNQVRVSYILVDAGSRRQLRADTITTDANDPFALEDRVAAGVVQMLDLELQPAEKKAFFEHGTSNARAFEDYLVARGYMQDYTRLENIESAIRAFGRALESDPNYAQASAGLGESYWLKFDLTQDSRWVERSRSSCQQAIRQGAAAADGHICLGVVYNGGGKYEEAISELRRAAEIEPTNDDAYRILGNAYEKLGRRGDAEATYRRAISLRPQYWAGHNWLGIFYFREARYAEAANMFARVVELAPDSFRGYSNLAGVYVMEGRYAEAIPLLQRSIAIRPSADAYSVLGAAHFYMRNFHDAAHMYQEAVKLEERTYIFWGNLGEAYYWSADTRPQAAAAYQRAVALAQDKLRVNPRDDRVLSVLAEYQAMLGERQQSLSLLQRALALSPANSDVCFEAAMVYKQLGDTERSLTWLEKALAAGLSPSRIRDVPNFDDLRSDPRLQRLLTRFPTEPRKS